MSEFDLNAMLRDVARMRGDAFIRVNAPARIALDQLHVQCEILAELRAVRALLERPPVEFKTDERVKEYRTCPECRRKRGDGHKATCAFGKAEASLRTPR